MTDPEHDFIVIGSGFGGSVSALRLVEKGYRVLLLEQGRELGPDDFPRTNWDLKRWLWLPALGWRGLFQMRVFPHITAMSGVGVGGGSLVYANTLPVPKRPFFENPAWAGLADWHTELEPHYARAKQMLGVATTPYRGPADEALFAIAEKRGLEARATDVAVFFGDAGVTVPDPYFGGEGPERTGCTLCGACMTGCRHGAKNTLDKNYLYLARRRGLALEADTQVTAIRPHSEGGYLVEARQGARRFGRKRVQYRGAKVILSAGAMGTVDLLLRLKNDPKGLPALSNMLGRRVRTNSESLIGVTSLRPGVDYSKGVAIGSILQTDPHSHMEAVRYGPGSGAFRPVTAPHVGGNAPGPIKLLQGTLHFLRHPLRVLRALAVKDWARSTMILLYMRSLEGTLRFRRRRGLLSWLRPRLTTQVEEGRLPTASIPEATSLAREVEAHTDGEAFSLVTETALNIPSTAHLLGGCPMGKDADEGVIDAEHRVFGYPGLYVVDGSAVSANPGVNPSLTITALAERAMSLIPPKTSL